MGILTEKYGDVITALKARYPDQKSAILLLMHIAQREYGYMSRQAMEEVAEVLELDSTHVLSLAGFYSLYYEKPAGKYVLEICTDLACALRGADEFAEMACQKLGVDVDEVTADGLFSVKRVMCLAACDKAPMLQCNLKYVENLTEEKFDALIAQLRAEAAGEEQPPSVVERIAAYAAAQPSQ